MMVHLVSTGRQTYFVENNIEVIDWSDLNPIENAWNYKLEHENTSSAPRLIEAIKKL